MNSGRQDNRAATVLVVNQLAAAGGAFLVNLIASRVLDPGVRGELALALQVCYIATVCALMGLERPFMSIEHGSFSNQYLRFTRLVLPGIWTVVPATIAALLVFDRSSYWVLIVGSAAYVVTNILVRAVRVAYVTSRSWRPFVLTGLSTQFMIVGGSLVLAFCGINDAAWWIGIYVLSGTAPLVLLMKGALSQRDAVKMGAVTKRSLRRQGLKLLPASLGNTAMVRSDRLLLPLIASSADLGIYVTVATVMEMAVWPVQQWVDVSLRKWTGRGSGVRVRLHAVILRGAILASGVGVLLGLLAYFVVIYLLPRAYAPAVSVIVPLGVASVLYSVTRIQQGLLIAMGASGRASFVETVGWISAIGSYLLLIPQLGIMGAAIGSIVGYGVCALTGFVVVRQKMRGAAV